VEGKFEGIYFNDSDVYKVLEGAAYSLADRRDPAMEKTVDEVIAKIASAQQPDGYLNTYYTLAEPGKRWTNLSTMHELYCAGHMIEGAVAHYRATGKRSFLDVAIRYADHIYNVFGPGKENGICGHEEIELALVKLFQVTGQEKYLELSKRMLDLRGDKSRRKTWGEYCQDHVPVRQQREIVGHAVRAYEDEKLEHIRIIGGTGKPMATILVGAATAEVVGERERIAKDAAASVQAALRGGVVPGGGSIELAVSREVAQARAGVKGMSVYGIDCVVEALKKPFSQIVTNAGFNPLEKIGDVLSAQAAKSSDGIAVDCDTGEVADMWELGVVDPALVKTHALKAAGEIAEAILRIDTIIKMKEDKSVTGGNPAAGNKTDFDKLDL
jgi:hypothetical protein